MYAIYAYTYIRVAVISKMVFVLFNFCAEKIIQRKQAICFQFKPYLP